MIFKKYLLIQFLFILFNKSSETFRFLDCWKAVHSNADLVDVTVGSSKL